MGNASSNNSTTSSTATNSVENSTTSSSTTTSTTSSSTTTQPEAPIICTPPEDELCDVLISLSCPFENRVIFIESAFYGRASQDLCPSPNITLNTNDTECRAELTALKTECNGQRECQLPLCELITFDDPCPETHKYFTADYICIEPTTTTTTTSTSTSSSTTVTEGNGTTTDNGGSGGESTSTSTTTGGVTTDNGGQGGL